MQCTTSRPPRAPALCAGLLPVATLMLAVAWPVVATGQAAPALRVALAGSAPFVVEAATATTTDAPSGIAVDLWAQAARRLDRRYTL